MTEPSAALLAHQRACNEEHPSEPGWHCDLPHKHSGDHLSLDGNSVKVRWADAPRHEPIVRCSDCGAELSPLHVCGLPAERRPRYSVEVASDEGEPCCCVSLSGFAFTSACTEHGDGSATLADVLTDVLLVAACPLDGRPRDDGHMHSVAEWADAKQRAASGQAGEPS